MDSQLATRQARSVKSMSITPSYPINMHYIKALFLARQFKECVRRCEEALFTRGNKIEAAHAIFLNFYAALSHESLARLMHVYSSSELPEICAAESAYLRALDASVHEAKCQQENSPPSQYNWLHSPVQHESAKPAPLRVRKMACISWPNEMTNMPISTAIVVEENKNRINFSWPRLSVHIQEPEVSTENETPSKRPSQIPVRLSADTTSRGRCSPSKHSSLNADTLSETQQRPSQPFSQSQYIDQQVEYIHSKHERDIDEEEIEQDTESASSFSPHLLPTSGGYISPVIDRKTMPEINYCNHLGRMEIQLRTHLRQVRALKQETMSAQAERIQRRSESLISAPATKQKTMLPQSRSFWSFKDPQAEKVERAARIAEGRTRGWRNERFDARKYLHLAEDALEELGIGKY